MDKLILESRCVQETMDMARKMAMICAVGDVICLDGDLGAGKTAFSQGFAQGLHIKEPVCSPTFTIMAVYEDGDMPLYHFDMYRIGDVSELDEIGCDEYFYGNGVCLIEWASLAGDAIPEKAYHVLIERDPGRGYDYRRITLSGNSLDAFKKVLGAAREND